jgi:hypothetical protein
MNSHVSMLLNHCLIRTEQDPGRQTANAKQSNAGNQTMCEGSFTVREKPDTDSGYCSRERLSSASQQELPQRLSKLLCHRQGNPKERKTYTQKQRSNDWRSVIRAMPNTPVAVDAGATALCRGRSTRREHMQTARAIFESVGLVVEVEEYQMDAVTALSGSGPMYVARMQLFVLRNYTRAHTSSHKKTGISFK